MMLGCNVQLCRGEEETKEGENKLFGGLPTELDKMSADQQGNELISMCSYNVPIQV